MGSQFFQNWDPLWKELRVYKNITKTNGKHANAMTNAREGEDKKANENCKTKREQ